MANAKNSGGGYGCAPLAGLLLIGLFFTWLAIGRPTSYSQWKSSHSPPETATTPAPPASPAPPPALVTTPPPATEPVAIAPPVPVPPPATEPAEAPASQPAVAAAPPPPRVRLTPDAQKRLDEVSAEVLARSHQSREYIAAATQLQQATDAMTASRASGDLQARMQASGAYNTARDAVKHLDYVALHDDPNYARAAADLKAAAEQDRAADAAEAAEKSAALAASSAGMSSASAIPGKPAAHPDRTDAKNVVTRADFDTITMGMTYKQMTDVVGSRAERLSQTAAGGVVTQNYAWKNRDGSHVNVTTQNGEVISKSQFGL